MPKKTRKAKIRASQRPLNVGYAPSAQAPTSTLEAPHDSFAPRPATSPTPIVGRVYAPPTWDYSYVYRDLRRIGLLAAAFFAIMFILWYVVEVQGIHLIPGVF